MRASLSRYSSLPCLYGLRSAFLGVDAHQTIVTDMPGEEFQAVAFAGCSLGFFSVEVPRYEFEKYPESAPCLER